MTDVRLIGLLRQFPAILRQPVSSALDSSSIFLEWVIPQNAARNCGRKWHRGNKLHGTRPYAVQAIASKCTVSTISHDQDARHCESHMLAHLSSRRRAAGSGDRQSPDMRRTEARCDFWQSGVILARGSFLQSHRVRRCWSQSRCCASATRRKGQTSRSTLLASALPQLEHALLILAFQQARIFNASHAQGRPRCRRRSCTKDGRRHVGWSTRTDSPGRLQACCASASWLGSRRVQRERCANITEQESAPGKGTAGGC